MDFVTLPFVQTVEDLMWARKVLDDAGGSRIKVRGQLMGMHQR